jgi:DNA-binding CsgD family transcriptional regulator
MSNAPLTRPGSNFQFRGSDLDEFSEVISRSIRPARFLGRAGSYETRLSQHRVGNLGFSVIGFGPHVSVTTDPVEDAYLIQVPLVGSCEVSCVEPMRVYRQGDINVVNPAAPLRVSMYPGTQMLAIRVTKSTLDEYARVLGDTEDGDGRCLLPESLPISSSEANSLRRYLGYLHAESMDPESDLHQGNAARSAEQMLISLMLALANRRSRTPRSGHITRNLRRAEEFIDGHADEGIGLVDIVRAAGVDARTLDAGLRRRRGAGALEWLDGRRAEKTARTGEAPLRLAPRELEVARLVAAGLNNHEIASCLAISYNTVKETLKRIFRKAEVDSRAELVARLAETGLL